ncbi:MAG: hypothetical protein M3Q42_11895 [Pseudomonadota bacterium]|nr:hypothetical protein [Pseudomonadota bacterium]
MRSCSLLLTFCFVAALCLAGCEVAISFSDEGPSPDNVVQPSPRPTETPVANLTRELREWNWGGGSCVHASNVMHLRWHNQLELAKWWRSTYAGGESYNGLTSKLRRAGVPFYDTAAGDVAVLERCTRERRGAVIFYYPNHSIWFVGFEGDKAYVLDNNRIEAFIEIPKDEFIRNWKGYGGVAIVPEVGAPRPPLPYITHKTNGPLSRSAAGLTAHNPLGPAA